MRTLVRLFGGLFVAACVAGGAYGYWHFDEVKELLRRTEVIEQGVSLLDRYVGRVSALDTLLDRFAGQCLGSGGPNRGVPVDFTTSYQSSALAQFRCQSPDAARPFQVMLVGETKASFRRTFGKPLVIRLVKGVINVASDSLDLAYETPQTLEAFLRFTSAGRAELGISEDDRSSVVRILKGKVEVEARKGPRGYGGGPRPFLFLTGPEGVLVVDGKVVAEKGAETTLYPVGFR